MKWDWDFGDGTGGSGPNSTHTYSSSGTYSVTLTVTDQCGVTKSRSRSVTVSEPSAPPPSPGPAHVLTTADADCCNGTAPGDPVSSATGELYFSTVDLSLGGMYPGLSLSRYYGSFLVDDGYVNSALGNNWMHDFDLRLLAGSTTATVVYYGGKIIQFEKTGGVWKLMEPEAVTFQLLEGDGHFHLFDPSTDLIYTFDYCQKLRLITNRNIKSLVLTYADDRLTEVSDEFGRSLRFTYTNNKLTRVQDQSGRSITFSYTGDNLTRFTDARGNTTTYSYTEAGGKVGLMTSAVLPEGNVPYTQVFDSAGRVRTQTDNDGNTVTLSYDTPTDGTTRMVDPLGNTLEHTHKDQKYLTNERDPSGATTTFYYDTSNRRGSWTDRNGNRSSVTYHRPSGKIASYTDAAGNKTTFTYTLQYKDELDYYNLTRIDFPDGTFVTMSHNWAGHVEEFTDRLGKRWSYTYNVFGQMLTATNPAGGVKTYTYDLDATLASMTDPFGNKTTFSYDQLKRLSRMTHPDGSYRSFNYDANDNLLSLTDERGKVITFSYDANDNLKATTGPAGETTNFSYSDHGRLTSILDAVGALTTFTYDGLGRVETHTNGASETYTFGYGPQGFMESVVDPAGNTTEVAYDQEGVPTSVSSPLSSEWDYLSDQLGRITAITSPLSNRWDYSYDSMGRLAGFIDPLSRLTSYTYDSRGALTGTTLPEEISATYARNDLGRITRVVDPNGNNWDRAYDEAGRLTRRTDPLGNSTTYAYDNRGRTSSVTFPEGSLQLTYDSAGNLVRRLYSDGTDVEYVYDESGRLVASDDLSLSYDARGDIVESNGLTVTRDAVGRIASVTLAPGKTVSYSYNGQGYVAQVSDWVGGSTRLTYDVAGRLAVMTRPNGVRTIYTYDHESRLVSLAEEKAGILSSLALTRNGVGEITSSVRNVPLLPDPTVGSQTFSYDAASQVQRFTYDRLGRLTADDKRTYTWDQASRLKAYSDGNSTVAFEYDGLDMKIGRTEGAFSRRHVWNYALGLASVSVVREGAQDLWYFVHLPGGRLLHSIEASSNIRRFYHFDEMGNTLFLTDDAAFRTDSYGVSPYGEVSSVEGVTENPFTFLGAFGVMSEGESGLYYVRARYYDSLNARFLSRDSVELLSPNRVNPYQYASMNPLRFLDPTGLSDYEKEIKEVGGRIGSINYRLRTLEKELKRVEKDMGSVTKQKDAYLNDPPKTKKEMVVEGAATTAVTTTAGWILGKVLGVGLVEGLQFSPVGPILGALAFGGKLGLALDETEAQEIELGALFESLESLGYLKRKLETERKELAGEKKKLLERLKKLKACQGAPSASKNFPDPFKE